MSWRIYQNEAAYPDARLIAWEIVLPYRHIHILDSDEDKVKELEVKLKELFTTYELHVVGKRIKERVDLTQQVEDGD